MAVGEHEFKNALKLWASGVTIVTTKTENLTLKGMTATSFSSVSLEPPQILVCINNLAGTGKAVLKQKYFAVNILKAGQQEIANKFSSTISQEERFSNLNWYEGKIGSPIVTDALVSVECTVVQQTLAGTHWIIIGEVQNIYYHSGGEPLDKPLLYFNSAYCKLQKIS